MQPIILELEKVHVTEMRTQLNLMRKEEKFTDVTLVCKGKRLFAHRVVLAAGSAFFETMFSGNFVEARPGAEVQLGDDSSFETWNTMLDFIYTGQLDLNEQNAQFLLQLAEYLQLTKARSMCLLYICAHINAENCLAVERLAEKFGYSGLLWSARNYAKMHWPQIMQVPSFLDRSGDEILAIFSADKLHMHSNDTALYYLGCWAKHRLPERAQELARIVKVLDPLGFTKSTVADTKVLKEHEETERWQRNVLSLPDRQPQWRLFTLQRGSRERPLNFMSYDDDSMTGKPLACHSGLEITCSLSMYKNHIFAQGISPSYYYNITGDTEGEWRPLVEPLKLRKTAASAVLDGGLYSLGGHFGNSSTSIVERLDLGTCVPQLCKSMLEARDFAGCAVANGCIYMVSGESGNYRLRSIERYDPRVGNWCRRPGPSLGCCSCAAIDGTIYAMAANATAIVVWDVRTLYWRWASLGERLNIAQLGAKDRKLYALGPEGISIINVPICTIETVFKDEPPNNIHRYFAATYGIVDI